MRKQINLIKGKVLTESVLVGTENIVKEYYVDKGFRNVKVDVTTVKDTAGGPNNAVMMIAIVKGKRVKIDKLEFNGNPTYSDNRLRRLMKKTKRNKPWNIFTVSRYMEKDYRNDKNSIIGTWGISVVVPYRRDQEGTAGSNVRQYTFNADGTYNFYIKTFRYSVVELSLTRETGTYRINGNNLTINPQKSVIEAWSKKDGTDKWGQLISSQNRPLEKTTYQFTKHYSVGMQHWAVVLQANKETKRDGYYNGDTLFSNAWIYNPVTCKDCFIKLPE